MADAKTLEPDSNAALLLNSLGPSIQRSLRTLVAMMSPTLQSNPIRTSEGESFDSRMRMNHGDYKGDIAAVHHRAFDACCAASVKTYLLAKGGEIGSAKPPTSSGGILQQVRIYSRPRQMNVSYYAASDENILNG